jgi:hypothetical protein
MCYQHEKMVQNRHKTKIGRNSAKNGVMGIIPFRGILPSRSFKTIPANFNVIFKV